MSGTTVSSLPSIAAEQHSSGYGSVVSELGFSTEVAGDHMIGHGVVCSGMWTPGTELVRTSVLATWADVLAGIQTSAAISPGIPVTVDLEVNVVRHPVGEVTVVGVGTVVKSGRSMTVTAVEFQVDGESEPFAFALATFMASPNPAHVAPEEGFSLRRPASDRPLSVPLATRARARRVDPGRVELPWCIDNSNATGAIQGGLISLSIEEAALSLHPTPRAVESISTRYLRAIREGNAVAQASAHGNLARVEVRAQATGKLAVIATVRLGD